MTKTEFETTIGDSDIDVTVEFGYCADSDERGSFIETELYKIYITADKSKTDIQCLLVDTMISNDELSDEAFKAAESKRESDEEDRAASRQQDRDEEY